jgi:hypothetical protein
MSNGRSATFTRKRTTRRGGMYETPLIIQFQYKCMRGIVH